MGTKKRSTYHRKKREMKRKTRKIFKKRKTQKRERRHRRGGKLTLINPSTLDRSTPTPTATPRSSPNPERGDTPSTESTIIVTPPSPNRQPRPSFQMDMDVSMPGTPVSPIVSQTSVDTPPTEIVEYVPPSPSKNPYVIFYTNEAEKAQKRKLLFDENLEEGDKNISPKYSSMDMDVVDVNMENKPKGKKRPRK